MMLSEFDPIADDYRIQADAAMAFTGRNTVFYAEVKARHILSASQRHCGPVPRLKILDVGCGIGLTDQFISPHVKKLYGTDTAHGMIKIARKANPETTYSICDGIRLPYENSVFDVSFAICVFHHVPAAKRSLLAEELCRVTREKGLVIIFEHNPFNPLARLIVRRCPFDKNAQLLTLGNTAALMRANRLTIVEKRHFLLTPWQRQPFLFIEQRLESLPLGAQYMAVGQKVPVTANRRTERITNTAD
jgi:SAM-dependent methyltransferase